MPENTLIYEIQKQELELTTLRDARRLPRAILDRYRRIIGDYDQPIKRYQKEEEEIGAKAKELAEGKEVAQRRAGNFGHSLIFLQIAIMLSSVAVLTRKGPLYHLGLATASGCTFFFFNAVLR